MRDISDIEQRIQDNLYELFAKQFDCARDGELFTSLANSVRQIIGKKWFESYACARKDKQVYLLSFEYSFGNQLLKNLIKLDLLNEVKELFKKHNLNFEDIKDEDIEFALGFGDLGITSGAMLDLFASEKHNIYAYGLRYRRGMLKQEIVNGEQIEKPDDWKVNKNPWEHEKGFSHYVNFKDYAVKAIPYDIPLLSNDGNHVNTLRLWKSFSINDLDFKKFSNGDIEDAYKDINRANSIVEFLYPIESNIEGKKLRLRQEYFFASSSIQDIFKKYKKYVDDEVYNIYKHVKIQIHDIHPVMSILVFIDVLINKHKLTFENSLEIAKKTFIFFQHSLLPETFESWDLKLINEICPNILDIIYMLDKHIKDEFLNNEKFNLPLIIIRDGYVCMINIAYYISKNIITLNGSHIELIKYKFMKEYYDFYNYKIKTIDFNYDTNQYLKEIYYDKDINENNILELTPEKLKKLKYENKWKLLEYLDIDKNLINVDSAFVMNMGVFHEYKRQILSALGIALLYYRLKKNPNLSIAERTYFFGGKSYPNYYFTKENIKFINALANQINNDLFIKDKIKIVFIENYNLTKSSVVIPAADIYQSLELLSMQLKDVFIFKSLSTGAAFLTCRSNYQNICIDENQISKYMFGDNYETVLTKNNYNLFEFLNQNKEIEDMFNFYRYLPKETFPYDINKIYNSIYYFNDENHIFKDLFEYVSVIEKSIDDYTNTYQWYQTRVNDCKNTIKIDDKSFLKKYNEILEN
ncbi:glycogen/starch/alpha-glucan phosphorylase [Helcococcus ovis]